MINIYLIMTIISYIFISLSGGGLVRHYSNYIWYVLYGFEVAELNKLKVLNFLVEMISILHFYSIRFVMI